MTDAEIKAMRMLQYGDTDEAALDDGTYNPAVPPPAAPAPKILAEPAVPPRDAFEGDMPPWQGPQLPSASEPAADVAAPKLSAADLKIGGLGMKEELSGGQFPGGDFSPEFKAEEARQKRIDDTKRNLALVQNLDLIGRSLAGLGKGGGIDTRRLSKADTSMAEKDYSDAEDTVSQADREFLRNSVGDLPADMKYSRLRQVLPTVAGTLNSRDRLAAQQAALEARMRQGEIGESRRQKSFERYPIAQAVALKGQKNTLDALDRIKADKAKVQNAVGPAVGRVNQLLGRWGASPPEVATLQAELSNVLSTIGKNISGATISDQEMARIKEQLPQMVQRGDTFDSLIDRIQNQIKTDISNSVQIGEGQGYDMAAFKWGQSGPQHRPGDMVTGPDGKAYKVKAVHPDGSVEVE